VTSVKRRSNFTPAEMMVVKRESSAADLHSNSAAVGTENETEEKLQKRNLKKEEQRSGGVEA
jgi:hypothetical protein